MKKATRSGELEVLALLTTSSRVTASYKLCLQTTTPPEWLNDEQGDGPGEVESAGVADDEPVNPKTAMSNYASDGVDNPMQEQG
jgi:hypothetical protein